MSIYSFSNKLGEELYMGHCVLCHGKDGEGEGRMAKILKAPPPANLVRSRLPDFYLRDIIAKGGQGVGRSPKMPPWGDNFDSDQIDAIIRYIKSIRCDP